jgi:beta,beta-carotene 9',10'-dioxygenase
MPGTVAPDRGLFGDIVSEAEPSRLAIEGAFPSWLRGSYIRNGPARFSFQGVASVRHWFDGLAYLQRFSFDDGNVDFAARFVRSATYLAALEGRRPNDAFGTPAALSAQAFFGRFFGSNRTDNPNVNVARYGGDYVALTEVGLPRIFDPVTLETRDPFRFQDGLGEGYTTAHPMWSNGTWINYTLKFGPTSRYVVWAMNAGGARRELAVIKSKRPSYVHSIGLSARFAILIEYPYTANALELLVPGRAFIDNFTWDGRAASKFHLIDLRGDRDPVTCEGEPFFCFHHIAAFDDGDDVVVDVVGYDDARIVGDVSISRLRANEDVALHGLGVRRYRCSPSKGAATREALAGENLPIEFPRTNARPGVRNRYYYGVRFGASTFRSDALCRIDVDDGTTRAYERAGESPGEAVFAARPGAIAEDDGALLFVTFDSERDESALVAIDAATFEELGRAWTGTRLPIGFHGQFHHTSPPS